MLKKKDSPKEPRANVIQIKIDRLSPLLETKTAKLTLVALVFLFLALFPFSFFMYQVGVMSTALLYVILGLGLNIVVGQAGLLHLEYIAFCAVGANTYALLHYHFGVGFWLALPLGGIFAMLLGFSALRLRGDYLAIVTLGFGEIVRIVLENWNAFSFGPSGIAGIPQPTLWGVSLSFDETNIYTYYIIVLACALTIVIINRLQDSRIGRALIALREDEIACSAM